MMTMTLKRYTLTTGIWLGATLSCVGSLSAYVFERVQDLEGRWRECDAKDVYGVVAPNVQIIMDRSRSMLEPSGLNGGPVTTQGQPYAEGTTDVGIKRLPASDPTNTTGRDALTLSNKPAIPPYLWVPSDGYNIVSKLNTRTGREEGRYQVGANPSRTAVDLDLNAWVGGRDNGLLVKVLADKTSCVDRNGNGLIDTSMGTNVLPVTRSGNTLYPEDECIAWAGFPRYIGVYGGRSRIPYGASIRGLGAGADGKMWIGYSSHGGGVQSIDVATFRMGPYRSDGSIPRWNVNSSGYFSRTNTTLAACEVYGLVVDRNGLLYASDTCRDRLPVYNTKTDQWEAIYWMGGEAMYGIATDAQARIWLGGWPHGANVRLFDPAAKRILNFPTPTGHAVTGLAVEPETGDVWATLHRNRDRVGRLKVHPTNVLLSSWQTIFERPGPEHGGVGFDADGYAWHVGSYINEAIKIDPKTNSVVGRYPVGRGGHYMYSDFTGSTALAFTAPSGRWRHAYPVGVPGQTIKSVKVEATVPADTSLGVRFRSLDRNGQPISPWFPLELNGAAQFYPYTRGASSQTFLAPDYNDAPFFAEQLEVDIKLSSEVLGKRPYLHKVDFVSDSSKPGILVAHEVAVGLSNAVHVPGDCTPNDATKCDYLRVGMSYFDSSYQQVAAPGENTAPAIAQAAATAVVDGLTTLETMATQIHVMPQLQDPTRDNYALIITDGKPNKKSDLIQAVSRLCAASRRPLAPVTIYAMGLGSNSQMNVLSLLAAAGGTGQCCVGASASCATPLDICAPSALNPYVVEVGAPSTPFAFFPYTLAQLQGLTCQGGMTAAETTAFKARLMGEAKESASRYKVKITDDPVMYNKPTYPQRGLLPDPNATQVTLDHVYWSRVELPYCEPASATPCGLEHELKLNGVPPSVASQYAHEGWYFEDPDKRDVVRLTSKLADEMAGRRVKNVTVQAACQCFKPEGSPCTVPGYDSDALRESRCAPGKYSCNAQAFDACVPIFQPMPEICNGLDDDCNGFADDLDDKRKSTKYGAGKTWQSVSSAPASAREELACNLQSVCVCDLTKSPQHLGQGASFEQELEEYLRLSLAAERTCLCGEGLTQEDVQTINALDAAQGGAPAAEQDPQASSGGCLSAPGRSTPARPWLVALALLGGAGVAARRRRA